MKKMVLVMALLIQVVLVWASEIATLDVRTSYAGFDSNGTQLNYAVIGDGNKGVNILITALDKDGNPADEDTSGIDLPAFASSHIQSSLGASVSITLDTFQYNRAIADNGIARAYISYRDYKGYASTDTITVSFGGLDPVTVTVALKAIDADTLYLRTVDDDIEYTTDNGKAISSLSTPSTSNLHLTQGGTSAANKDLVMYNGSSTATVPVLVFAARDGNFTAAPNLDVKKVTITAHRADANLTLCALEATMNDGVATATFPTSTCTNWGKLYGETKIFFSAKSQDYPSIQTETPSVDDDPATTRTLRYDFATFQQTVAASASKISVCLPYRTDWCVERPTSSMVIPEQLGADGNSSTVRFMPTDPYYNVAYGYEGRYGVYIKDGTNADFNISAATDWDGKTVINSKNKEVNISFDGSHTYVDVVLETNTTNSKYNSTATFAIPNQTYAAVSGTSPTRYGGHISGINLISTTAPSLTVNSYEGNKTTSVAAADNFEINATSIRVANGNEIDSTTKDAYSGATIKMVFSGGVIDDGYVAASDKFYVCTKGNNYRFRKKDATSEPVTADKECFPTDDSLALATEGLTLYAEFEIFGVGSGVDEELHFIIDGMDVNASHLIDYSGDATALKVDTSGGKGFDVLANRTDFAKSGYIDFNETKIQSKTDQAIDMNSASKWGTSEVVNEELYVNYDSAPVKVSAPIVAAGDDINYTIFDDIVNDVIIQDNGYNTMNATLANFKFSSTAPINIYKGPDLNISIPSTVTTTSITLRVSVVENTGVYKDINFTNVVSGKSPTQFAITDLTGTGEYTVANNEKVIAVNTNHNDGNQIFYRIEAEEDSLFCDVSLWELDAPYATTPLVDDLGEGTSDAYDADVTMAFGENNVTTLVVRCDDESQVILRVSDRNGTITSDKITLNFTGGDYTPVSISSLPSQMCKGDSNSTVSVSGGSGSYYLSAGGSSSIADVVLNGSTVSVDAQLEGNLTVTVTDNISSATTSTAIVECPEDLEIDLYPGWNMVSGEVSITSIPNLLEVWVFAGSTGKWTKNPSSIAENEGAWVKVNKAGDYSISSATKNSVAAYLNEYTFVSGNWYLLGAPIEFDINLIMAYATKFWTYDGSTESWSDTETGTLSVGRGFWIKAE